MPTSKDSPTAGEITQNDIPDGTTEPGVPLDPEPEEELMDFAEPVVETNFPLTDPTQPEEAQEAAEEWEPEAGETWSIWNGLQPGERILTVADLKEIGDKNAEEPLVWDRNNRWRREVSDVHPMVLDYIENIDDLFTVVRYE